MNKYLDVQDFGVHPHSGPHHPASLSAGLLAANDSFWHSLPALLFLLGAIRTPPQSSFYRKEQSRA